MIKLFILNIINKFIQNRIELHSNGLYSFKSDYQKSDSEIEEKTHISCFKLVEETLKEMNYFKAEAKISRDDLYKIIVEIENLSGDSLILLMAYLRNYEQTDNDIEKLNNSLISHFHTNDIDFFLGILVNVLGIKSGKVNDFISIITDFKSMLCFLTNTPYEIDTTVGIYDDIIVDDNINIAKTYKIKYKKNSLDLNSTKKDKCFDQFYIDPDINPIRRTKPANVFLKAGWERKLLKQLEIKGVLKKTANWIYNDLMFLVGKSKDTQEVYFKNEPMCQRRWTNDEIQNDEQWDADYDGEEYIDIGEDVFNLYDPEVTEHTPKNSDLYKNNEILKKIWFYSDDLFPVQPHKSPIFNFLDRRAEFAFKTLQVPNKDIFKSSPFKKEDLHIILPILWLYKIYDEYKSIASMVEINNKIKLFFDYFKPEDMLLYFKKYILIENNTFDTETLSFLIILGSLSKMTSLLVDERVIKDKIKDFEPKNFNLFGRLGVHEIKELIQNHPKKRSNYVSYLNIIIERYIFDDDLISKIHEEVETRNDEKRQYYIKLALNVMQITSNLTNFINVFGYNAYQIYKKNNTFGRQLLQIDNNIEKLITPELISQGVAAAESNDQMYLLPHGSTSNPISITHNGTSYTSLAIMNYKTPGFYNQPVPMVVHLSIASNLAQYISGNKSISGMNVSNALKALNLIKYKSSVISNDNSVIIPNITLSNIHNSFLNIDPLVTGLLGHLRNSTGSSVTASNSEIVELLFQTGELEYNYSQAIHNFESRLEFLENDLKKYSEKGLDVQYEISTIPEVKQQILDLERQFKQQKYDLHFKLTSISEQVPIDSNIVSVKVLSHLHGTEPNINKRMIMNCGKFKYIGLIGEAGRNTAFQIGDEYMNKVFNGIPVATNIPEPLSEYCEVPIIQFELQDSLLDNAFGGIIVELQYKNGTKEQKNIANNQQLSKIFEKNKDGENTNAFDLPSFLPVLEQILRLNGLDSSISSVVFDSCRGLGLNYPLKKTAEYIFDELAINAEICLVGFNPQVPVEFIPNEVKRVYIQPNQYMGQVIAKEPRPFFDPNNPRRYAGHNLKLRFGNEQGEDKFLCLRKENPEVNIHYSFLMAFNHYLTNNPNLLTTFNRLSPERRYKLFNDTILNPDYMPMLQDPENDEIGLQMKYKHLDLESIEVRKQLNKEIWFRDVDFEPFYDQVFHEHFFPPKQGERFMELHMGTPSTPFPDMNYLLRQHIRKLNEEQFREKHPNIGFLAGILAGGNNKNKLNGGYPEKDIDLDKLMEEAQHFHFNTYMNDLKTIYFEDPSILHNMNELHINNVFKSIKIQIEKIKIYIRITLKRNIDEEYFKFIYSYFYEVVYRYLLMILNEYKKELNQLEVKLKKAREYFDLFEKNCIKENFLDFKTQKMNKSDILEKINIFINDYNLGILLKTRDFTGGKQIEKWNKDIISILKNLQYDDHPISKSILDKHRDLIDDLIVQRWANYIILYDIPLTSCDLKTEIEKIEFTLLMETSININILEPLTLFIPNYIELIQSKYDFYMDKALSLIRDKNYDMFIDCDFVKNYYKLIYNKIVNIQSNIFEIRKTNIDINEFFNIRRMKNLNNPFALPAKNNIYAYSEQLSYYLNNVDKIFNIVKDDIPLENDIQTIEIKPMNENVILWLAENTPNTVENRLLFIRNEFNKDYENVKMNDIILSLIV